MGSANPWIMFQNGSLIAKGSDFIGSGSTDKKCELWIDRYAKQSREGINGRFSATKKDTYQNSKRAVMLHTINLIANNSPKPLKYNIMH